MSRTRPYPTAVAVGAALLLLSACGSSAAPDPTGRPAPGTAVVTTRAAAPAEPAVSAAPAAATVDPTDRPAGTTTDGTTHGGTGACSVITRQDIRSVLGTDPGDGTEDTSRGSYSRCAYGGRSLAVLVFVITGGQGTSYFDAFPARLKTSGIGEPVTVPGVGERAFGVFHQGGSSIVFRKGAVVVTATVIHPLDHSTSRSEIIQLATVAAGRV